MQKNLLTLLLIAAVFLSACAPACDVDAYTKAVAPIQARWEDAVSVANTTPRMSLPAQVNELQAIKRDLDGVEHDACLNPAHDNLVLHYQYTIDGFLEFLADADDFVVSSKFSSAEIYFENYEKELAKLDE